MDADQVNNFNDALRITSRIVSNQLEQLAKIIAVTEVCLLPTETALAMLEEAYRRTRETNFTVEKALIDAQRRLGMRR